jgi:predicted anti-sigma-YlaC factor YlaD
MIFPRLDRLIVAGFRALWWKLRGWDLVVPWEVHEKRIAECENCRQWFCPMARQCLQCTCFVDIKTWVAPETCPAGKWGQFKQPCRLSRSKALQ